METVHEAWSSRHGTSPRRRACRLAAARHFAATLIAAAATPLVLGQAHTAPQDLPRFADRGETVLVSFEVTVTGPAGPVAGLTREAFEVLHDGRRVELTHFAEFRAVSNAGSTVAAIPEPAQEAAPTVAPAPQPEPILWCYYVDNENLTTLGRTKVLRYLTEHVRTTLHAPDRAMVVSFERRPRVVTAFTWNPDRIVSALDSIGGYVGRRMADNSERAEIQSLVDRATPAGRGGSNLGELALLRTRAFATEQRAQLSLALRGLTSVVTMLGGVPGRREVLYLSEGLPSAPGEDLFADLSERMADPTIAASATSLSLWPQFQEVARAAAAQRVAIHALDARGLMAPGGDASSGGTGRDWEWHRRSGTQETLQFLADETGGIAVVDSNDFAGALGRIESASAAYYLIGYPLPPGGKPEHEVKVTLKRRGPEVLRYRRRFVERSLRDLVTDQVAAGLVLDLSTNDLGITAGVGPAQRAKKGRWDVPLKVAVPIRPLLLASSGDALAAQLELLVATREEDREEESPVISQRHSVAIPREKADEARDGVWPIDVVVAVKPGRYRISVGVRDEGSGLAGYAVVRASVGAQ